MKKTSQPLSSEGARSEPQPEGSGQSNVRPGSLLAFIGVTDVTFLTAGDTPKLTVGAVDRQTFLRPALEQVRAAAA